MAAFSLVEIHPGMLCVLAGSKKDKGFNLTVVPKDVMFSTADLETWISQSTLFQQIFHEVFHACFRLYVRAHSNISCLILEKLY